MGAAILEKLSLIQESLFKNKTLLQLSLTTKSHKISLKRHVTTMITNQIPLNSEILWEY